MNIGYFSKKDKKTSQFSNKKGFTLLELVVVSGLMMIIAGISMTVLRNILNKQRVEKDAESAYAYLLRARNQTIVGEGGDQYGVAFSSTSITLFRGTTYSTGDPNAVTFTLLNDTVFQNINFSNGSTQLYFKKLTGRPSATGTVEVISKTDSTIRETLIIHASGLTEVQ